MQPKYLRRGLPVLWQFQILGYEYACSPSTTLVRMATPALQMAAFSAIQRSIIDLPLAAVCVRPFFFCRLTVRRMTPPSSCCWGQLQRGQCVEETPQRIIGDDRSATPLPGLKSAVSDGRVNLVAPDAGFDRSLGYAKR